MTHRPPFCGFSGGKKEIMGKKIVFAWLAALLLAGSALAAEPPAPEPVEPESAVRMEVFGEAEVFQAGAISGPQTMPEEELPAAAASLYDTIYQGLVNQNTSISVESHQASKEAVGNTFFQVVNDHPELFYVQSRYSVWSYGNIVAKLEPSYYQELMSADCKSSFDSAVNRALSQLDSGMTPMEKALVLHDYLVVNCAYNWAVATTGNDGGNKVVYSAYGALVNGDAVCQGYALAYKYLLNRAGIQAILISSNALNHAWNLVELNGKWYHVDVTWDDPVPDFSGQCSHENFLRSHDGIVATGHGKNGIDWRPSQDCSDDSYASGYVFNDNLWPIYRKNGSFYYVQGKQDSYQVLKGGLKETGQTLTTFRPLLKSEASGSYYPLYFGIVWLEDSLYYIGSDAKLHAYNLLGYGEQASTNTVSFTPQPSQDNKYSAISDFVALRYRNGKIQAVSRTRPALILAEFAPMEIDYPPEWAGLPGFQIAGLTANGTKVGIMCNEERTGAGYRSDTLWVACYQPGGKLASVQMVELQLKKGLNIVTLPKPVAAPDGGAVRLMVTVLNMPMLCPAKTVTA